MPGLIGKSRRTYLFVLAIPEEYGGLGRIFITTVLFMRELSNMGNSFPFRSWPIRVLECYRYCILALKRNGKKYIPSWFRANGRVPTA